MIPAPTRAEHYHALRGGVDSLGYCKNLFYDKTNSKLPQWQFFSFFKIWLNTKPQPKVLGEYRLKNHTLLTGCEHIKKYYSEKFA